jgi:putative transposase
MNDDAASKRPIRKQLDPSIHFHGRFGATYFITVCCEQRGSNHLCKPDVARELFKTAQQYHISEEWYLELLLLMPDHLHMLVAISGDADLSKLIRDFKRIAARKVKIHWQRNFFDHRLRHDESESEKYEYILQNPVRAGLVNDADDWPYQFVAERRAIEGNRPYLQTDSTRGAVSRRGGAAGAPSS